MKRVLALAGAIGMIAAAFVVRDLIEDADGSGGGGGDGSLQLVCATDLRDECEALADADGSLEITYEQAADTVARLADPAAANDVDGWITLAPWPEMANIVTGDDLFAADAAPSASSAISLLFPEGPNSCTQQDWQCLGTAPQYRVGMPRPTSALGAVFYGAATTAYFGRADIGTNDIDLDDGFPSFSRQLLAHADDDPIGELLRVYPPTIVYDALPATGADIETRILPSRAAPLLVVSAPGTPGRVDLVVVAVQGGPRQGLVERLAGSGRLAEALGEHGWEGAGTGANGLPSAGVLVTLAGLS